MKKVIVVFHDNNIKSGATASMLSLIKYWKTHNYFEVEAIIPKDKGSLAGELDKFSINYYIFNYNMVRYHVDNNIGTRALKYLRAFFRVIRDIFTVFNLRGNRIFNNVDYIYSNTSSIYFGFFLSQILCIKHVWHFREFGFEDQNCKHIFSDHFFYKLANKYSDKIIVISRSLEEKIRKYIDGKKIFQVYNGIDSKNIIKKNEISLKNKSPLRLIITGSVIPNKGQEFVIEALYQLKLRNIPFQLGIAGDGKSSYVNYLKEKCNKYNIAESVNFHGFVSNMETILDNYDIAIISSKSEAFGRVTVESMIMGLLIVCSNTGANKELVSDENGYIYMGNSTKSLVDILEYIYFQDEIFKLDKIKKSMEVSNKFTVDLCAKSIYRILIDCHSN
ncbi:hypothetical protein A3K93_12225 [Acinetobacter sp. NCu2D-2]|uniref:glycosyltransferase family 4 protein n=1 Tax=Acinetobacter sp. NCu2D-2 TaxID=1608473 RepID=UPI0007CDC20C|nr:glycosyltransferase family 4 protein [Acinetobacter sp. NCu2D-2]ANF82878.1 hypothetical protein A3K93_12225 [Acinetobacter sp. NCu2D-2]